MATTSAPAKIGKYDVLGVIGRGGMGVVYQAKDPVLGRLVAIKMITGAFSESPDMLRRFFREAQSLASLQHPNIVTVFDLGDFGGNPYFVMEYLEGEGLDSVMANCRPMSLLEKLSIIVQVCNGLGYAHCRGVVHRDIKPANIMICKDGGIKIFDFGIAHAGQMQTAVTRTGEVLGTLRYMAPEQVNSKTTDARTDIFSTGVMLYQLVTEHLPFEGENTASTLMKIVSEPPPPLGTFLKAYPPEIEEILDRALAKNPNDRYATAEDFAMDLSQLQGQLKEEVIGREMEEVAALIDQGEVYKAQSSLQRVLKIDQHNAKANRLLREVLQRIQRDESSKQVRALREHAEEALADQQFEQAAELVDRALGMDRSNGELQQLREQICAAAEQAEKLHKALKAAETAQMDGNLEAAKEAAEAALALAPNDTQARTLYRAIVREIEERALHQQMEGYLLEAQREISSRRFTAAIEILKQAEELQPGAPQVHTLMESAVAGREQERRRRVLEALVKEVEEALNRDDYRAACAKADEGLAQFPEDRNLLKLKALAGRQRQIEERRQLIDGLMTESRNLLQAGRHEELRDKLERALAQLGPDARLESLLGVVKERLQRDAREQQRAKRLADARQFIDDQSYDHAIKALEAATRESGEDEEVRELLRRARAEQAEAVQSALTRAEQEVVLARRVEILDDALSMSPQDARVREALHQARNLNQVISRIAVEAQRLEEEGRYDQALAKWETVSAVHPNYPRLKEIIKRLHDVRDGAQANARQGWIDKIERALNAGEYDQASAISVKASEAFPWDTGVMALQERAENASRSRAKALKLLAEGRKALASQQWDAGSQIMVRAYQAASSDTMIRDQAMSELAQASRATINNNWQAAEVILKRLAEIEPSAAGSRDLQATIEARRKEDTINSAMNAARRQQGNGNLQGALRELEAALAAYPEDRRLTDLQGQLQQKMAQAAEAGRQEEIRRQREVFVQTALSRAQQTPALDARVAILEEAVNAEPQEARLQQQLIAARGLRTRVMALAAEARAMEQASDFEQALVKWEAVAALHRDYPDLGKILDQVRQRHQRALLEAKGNCVRSVQQALASGGYKRAEDLLGQAKRVFPGDRELAELEKRVRDGMATRAHAEKILEGAAKAAGKEKWRKALDAYLEASAVAKGDSVIQEQVVNGLLAAAEAAVSSDREAVELLTAEAARLEPASPQLAATHSRIDAWKRGRVAEQCLAEAQKCVSSGDWQGALRALDRGLATYPSEERMLARRGQIEGEMRRRAEELGAREARQGEAREKEVLAKAQREEEQRLARERELREKARREEEQWLAREQEMRLKAAEERAGRARALEEERLRAQPAVPAAVEEMDLSATQIFIRGTGNTGHIVAPTMAAAAANPELPTSSPPLPPVTPVVFAAAPAPSAPAAEEMSNLPTAIFSRSSGSLPSQRPPAVFGGATPNPLSEETIPAHADVKAAPNGEAAQIQPGVQPTNKDPFVGAPAVHPTNKDLFVGAPGAGSDELTENSLQMIERNLAGIIGPLAKILVRREASKTKSLQELYTILADRLEREEDRKAFLAKRTETAPGKAEPIFTKLAPVMPATPAAPAAVETPGEISQADIEQAGRKLVTHLGPIGLLVAKKEAKRATTLREFYELLAGHVEVKDRELFLKEAGVVLETPKTSFLRPPEGITFLRKPGDKTSSQTRPIAQPEPERKA